MVNYSIDSIFSGYGEYTIYDYGYRGKHGRCHDGLAIRETNTVYRMLNKQLSSGNLLSHCCKHVFEAMYFYKRSYHE